MNKSKKEVWCEHIKLICGIHGKNCPDKLYEYWLDNVLVMRDWKLCPICGAKRPGGKSE